MGPESCITNSNRWLRDRVQVTRRNGLIAEHKVAFRADKLRTLISLINFVVENSAFIRGRCDVTAFTATARFHGDLMRLATGRIHCLHVMALFAFQIRMSFMTKGARRKSRAPGGQRPPIRNADSAGQLLIKIRGAFFSRGFLVTRIAALR